MSVVVNHFVGLEESSGCHWKVQSLGDPTLPLELEIWIVLMIILMMVRLSDRSHNLLYNAQLRPR